VVGGISGTGNAYYMAQMRRAASNTTGTAGFSLTDVSKSQPLSKSQVSMEEIFSKIDTDGNGVISKDEFDKAKSNSQGKITDTQAGAQSGMSTSSLLSLLESSAKQNSKASSASGSASSQIEGITSDQLFSKLDTNGDGVVSKEELTQTLSGTTGGSGTASDKQTIARNIADQTSALMAQVINRYTQFTQSAPTMGSLGNLLLTG